VCGGGPDDPHPRQLRPGVLAELAGAVGDPVQGLVVEDHQLAVGGGAHVDLQVLVAQLHRAAEGGHRVLPLRIGSAVGEGQRRVVQRAGPGVQQIVHLPVGVLPVRGTIAGAHVSLPCSSSSMTRATPSSSQLAVIRVAAARAAGWPEPTAQEVPAQRSISTSLGIAPNAMVDTAETPSRAAKRCSAAALLTPREEISSMLTPGAEWVTVAS